MQGGDIALKQIVTAIKALSLLKSIEGDLGLPCLNRACDSNVNVMSDLFGNYYNSQLSSQVQRERNLLLETK
jgi:hypothetical protein